jgi:hypothetical protein
MVMKLEAAQHQTLVSCPYSGTANVFPGSCMRPPVIDADE